MEDTPDHQETIYVYRIRGEAGRAFVDGRDPKTGKRFGKCIVIADYDFLTDQPDDMTLRDTDKWHAWVEDRAQRDGLI